LQSFSVNNNQLTGTIPSLSGLTALQSFWVNNNQLTGTIPSLSGLTALQSFAVSDNQLTGAIPAAPPALVASFSFLCNNQLQSSGNAAIDAAWTTVTGVDWLACQTVTATRYSKIANNGSVLADSAVLGSGQTDWACTRDNTTGLIWEVKTADGGLRDWNKTYTNYDDPTQAQKWNGSASANPTQAEIDATSNSIGLVNAVNASALCGTRDWKMPGKDELLAIVDTSYSPPISPTYFPNTGGWYYWSGSPGAYDSTYAWYVDFVVGYASDNFFRNFPSKVLLVRGGQSIGTFGLTLSATGSGSGTLTSSPGSLNCSSSAGTTSGTCAVSLAAGSTVTLTATPASGSSFSGWSGACSGTSSSCTVIMAARKSATASFSMLPSQTISFVAQPSLSVGGSASVSATASSKLPVTLSSLTTSVCTLSGNTVTAIAVGTCTLAANQAGNSTYAAAPQVTQSFTIGKVSQSISFAAAPSVTVGGTGTVSATASSKLPVTLSSLTTSVCTVSGNTVTALAVGTCTLAANQAGNSTYAAAPQVTQSVTIGKVSQTISFDAAPSVTVGGTGTVSATASSKLPVTLSSLTTSVCTVSGNSVTAIAVGTCTLAANQAGNSTYAAAPQVTQSVTIGKVSQTISFDALSSVAIGGTGKLKATASSGLTVTFSSLTTSVCTVSGSSVTAIAAGTCTLAADQAGNSSYDPAPQVTKSFSIAKVSQTISFGTVPGVRVGAAVSVGATASSGLSVTLSTSTANVCSVSGSTVTGVAVGSCSLTAHQAGNASYSAAPEVTQSITVDTKNQQTISFGAAPTVAVGGSGTLSATSSAGLTVTFSSQTPAVCSVSGSTVSGVAVGVCQIAASQPGDAITSPASHVAQSFTIVTVLRHTLTVDASGVSIVPIVATPSTYGGTTPYSQSAIAAGEIILLVAPGGVGSAIFSAWSGCDSASGTTCSLTLNASKTVTATYRAALLSQSITFGAPPTLSAGGTRSISATASSGLALSFSSNTTSICTVSGSSVSGIAAGTCVIVAQQAGDSNTSPAAPVTQSFNVAAAPLPKSYRKVANDGSYLPNSAGLGSAPSDWACTFDDTSGLLWEVKSSDGGMRDVSKLYTHFDDATLLQKWNGSVFIRPTKADIEAEANSVAFVQAVAASLLCGSSEWRMPSKDELQGLLDPISLNEIDPTFFPNTASDYFWSASPSESYAYDAWNVYFGDRGAEINHRHHNERLRLVSGRNASETLALSLTASGSGSGRMSSDIDAIDCASQAGATSGTCQTNLARGTLITLTATPKAGSTFVGWSGGCTGTGQCKFPINATTAIDAKFNPIPFLVNTQLQLTPSSSTLETRITFNSSDLGRIGHIFVTARVPASALSTLPMAPVNQVAADLKAAMAFSKSANDATSDAVTLQLTAAGWALIENGQLIPYASGALNDLLAAQKILDSADPRLMPGAQFCVGYGDSALEMLNNDRLQLIATIPDGGTVFTGSCLDVDSRGTATEFYHNALKHYFITIDPDEAAGIDAGAAGPGWVRTHGSFKVWPNSANGGQPVCRFYGSLDPGPNSHFFTVSADECAGLRAQQASTPESIEKWHYENTAFYIFTPINGGCASGSTPVYRYYNNGFAHGEDSNHRLTADAAQRASMEAAGWVSEGVVMCAP
jgi:hypothetical protein